ncbi:ankyrin repeat domain-containing protein SOWAHB-like isoform X1 [Pomacea canaliculata]|uniref:ankyrin repeat domain-containing protein SOWAHB-like isoform X1 n=1 Tax=Pomacea canaliculata TaxID=400727 RepID=UPI000D738EEE|nr:ankyrin repeat domain-containing protein SOWAHB-like isoform X1 [Pomacea canaliculata]
MKYTALHWAAKAGNSDVVKLLANKIGVNVNQRSYGGYTPLHLAAIHGHEDVIDLLVNTYKADVNIRDYSGKKPKQYLKNSASSQAQQLLVSRRLGADLGSARSVDDSFVRSTNARKSNRISSLLQATSPLMRHTSMRGNWDVVVEEREPGAQSLASPSMRRRRGTAKDKELMPPPQVPLSRRRQTDRTTSSSHDNLDAGPHLRDSDSSDLPYVQTVPRSESDPAMAKKSFS